LLPNILCQAIELQP